MNTVFSGTAHDLSKLFETPGYRLFLFTKGCENEYRVNLGMNRFMKVKYAALLLIPENGGKLRMEILKATEEKQSVSVAGELKRLGIKYKVIADYDKKLKWQFHPAWKNALCSRWMIFSEAGYALQYVGWLDGVFVQFEMHFNEKNHLEIESHDIMSIYLTNVSDNVMEKAEYYITKMLESPCRISETEFVDAIKAADLWDMQPYFVMYERE